MIKQAREKQINLKYIEIVLESKIRLMDISTYFSNHIWESKTNDGKQGFRTSKEDREPF